MRVRTAADTATGSFGAGPAVGRAAAGPARAGAMTVFRSGGVFPPPASACGTGGSIRPELSTMTTCPVVLVAHGEGEDIVATAPSAVRHLLYE
jgi:hypothetical protein